MYRVSMCIFFSHTELEWSPSEITQPSGNCRGHQQAEALLGKTLDRRSLKGSLEQAIMKSNTPGVGGTFGRPCQGIPLRNYTLQQIWYKRGLLGRGEE